ncbi:MAG TPA: dockerin type I domain-containing protein [Phycisphaerae bacterium]|nr:dockerin type I domain-containing protein [Phycisphaerae bacterium]
MRRTSEGIGSIAASVVMVACLLAGGAAAADFTWDGGAYVSGDEATRNWDLAANWAPDGVPASGQTGLVNMSSLYARANADLTGSPSIEVATGGLVAHVNGVTVTTAVTLSGGTWHTCPNLSGYPWGPDRVLNADLVVTDPSFMKGGRGNNLAINGLLQGSALLTFEASDSYQGDGPEWFFYHADSTHSAGLMIESGNNPVVWAMASQALGTGDITVRSTGTVGFGANQDYSGAARTPVIYLEGSQVMLQDYLSGATIPMDIIVGSEGGTIYGYNWCVDNSFTGAVTLNANMTLAGTRLGSLGHNFTIDGAISGDGGIVVNSTDQYQGSRGTVVLGNAANSYNGGTTVQTGYLKALAEGTLSTGQITLYSPDIMTRLFLDKPTDADWTLANDITADGTVQVEDGSVGYTLNLMGSTVTVGTDDAVAGTMTVAGNLAFVQDGNTPVTLNIGVIGTGDPVVVSNDALAVTRSVGSLSNCVLNVSILGADYADLAGETLTILTCTNDLSAQSFADVVYPTGWKGIVTYGSGWITLSLAPEDEDRPVLDLVPESLGFSVKASEPNPAPASVQVRNVGFGTTHWNAAVRSPAPSWISLTNTSGSDDDSFDVHIDRQGLPDGTYTAYVDVEDPNAVNSPQTATVVLQARPDAESSTQSFTNSARGTHPSTLTASGGGITVDLSALPGGTQIFRAILVPHASGFVGSSSGATSPLQVQSADAPGVWLQTVAPNHLTLDCTAAAQRALLAGDKTLGLDFVSFPAGLGSEVRLDVWCDAPPAGAIQQVTNLAAVHREGDTMLTFAEVDPPVTDPAPTGAQLNTAKANMDSPNEIRYRIYRSSSPIDAITIRTAELVDEITPMSGWNWTFGPSDWDSAVIPTLPVDELTASAPGAGIYVRRAGAAGSAYYGVSRAVDGEEDLSIWMPNQNSLASTIAEDVGTGMVLKWKQVGPTDFYYESNVMKHYFVRWECPPTWNTPSYAHNYLVCEPLGVVVDPRPVDVALHCWGGNMEGGWGWWYEANRGALLLTTMQIPYDWWTAYHENRLTIRPWTNVQGNGGGVVRNYCQKRIWSFVADFMATRWNVDLNHILVSGSSMGGSGSSMWGIRSGDKFAYIDSWVGVHIPALCDYFRGSFEQCYGLLAWDCLYEDTGMSVWDYWDTEQWLRSHIPTDTPFISFANGKNDGAIGWWQAWLMATALQETRRPHLFHWSQQGHLTRAALPGTLSDRYIGIDIDKNKTLPAFTYCSLDDNMGDGDPEVGDPVGYLNAYLLWDPNDSVDTTDAWEMTCYLINAAPQESCTVDITPRRCQTFGPVAETVCNWSNTDVATSQIIQSGTATVDAHGLVTLPQVTVSKTRNRIRIDTQVLPVLVSSDPVADGTLCKTQNNVMLLTFDGAIALPDGGAPALSVFGGGFEEGGTFTYSIEPDGVTLRAVEQGPMLTDLTWYRIAPAAGFAVEPFSFDACTLFGDANGNGRVTTADYVEVKDHMGAYTDGRCDLNGSGRVTTADYSVVKSHMGHRTPTKP